MKKEYSSPQFELHILLFTEIMSGEMSVSDPQIPTDAIDPGELD